MRKIKTRQVTIPKDQEKQAIDDILLYFEHERRESIGNMEGLMIFTFIMEKIAPSIYNQAIVDAQKFMSDKVEDLYELMF